MAEIDDEVYDALNVPESEREATARTELAVSLSDRGVFSFGNARALAERSKREVHQLLGEREIERHYTAEELDEDAEYARGGPGRRRYAAAPEPRSRRPTTFSTRSSRRSTSRNRSGTNSRPVTRTSPDFERCAARAR
jgi:predicted HTH domain antitoxin